MAHGFIFDLDPVLIRLGPWHIDGATFGPLEIRYYGIVFFFTLWTGYLLWRRQLLRGGYAEELANRFIIWGVLAVIIGARLGHCLFYEPEYYLANPLEMVKFWQGGLASHGATIGVFVAVVLFSRLHHLRLIEMMDRLAMSAAVGATGIRLGNFLNSEIVGRTTDLPWAVRFMRYDNVPRHPSQLYEFALGLFVLLVLYLADRWAGKENRPVGLMCGLFFTVYFAGRFFVEFVKEYLTPIHSGLTTGQYLSIAPFLCGVGLLLWAWQRRQSQPAGQASPATAKQPRRRRRRT